MLSLIYPRSFQYVGASASGKLADFDSAIPRFESLRPNHFFFKSLFSSSHFGLGSSEYLYYVHLRRLASVDFLKRDLKKKGFVVDE